MLEKLMLMCYRFKALFEEPQRTMSFRRKLCLIIMKPDC